MPFLEYRGQLYPLDDGVILGRGTRCSLLLQDIDASRRHARVWCQGDKALFQDLGSRNGTCLNGRPLCSRMPTALSDGDVLTIGKDTIRFWQQMPDQDVDHTTVHTPAAALHLAGPVEQPSDTTLPPES